MNKIITNKIITAITACLISVTATVNVNAAPILDESEIEYIKSEGYTIEGDFAFKSENDKAYLGYYVGDEKIVTLPVKIDGKPITEYNPDLFQYCVDSLEQINMKEPEGDWPGTFDSMYFEYLASLKAFNVDNKYTTSLDGVLLSKDKATIICYPRAKEGKSYSVPESVSVINEGAFAHTGLESVKLPSQLLSINDQAFKDSEIKEITIPDSVKIIGSTAFLDCRSLESVTIPGSVNAIGGRAFGYFTEVVYFDYGSSSDTLVKNPDFVIKGSASSAAFNYAQENGFKFVDIATGETIDPPESSLSEESETSVEESPSTETADKEASVKEQPESSLSEESKTSIEGSPSTETFDKEASVKKQPESSDKKRDSDNNDNRIVLLIIGICICVVLLIPVIIILVMRFIHRDNGNRNKDNDIVNNEADNEADNIADNKETDTQKESEAKSADTEKDD